MFPDDDLKSLNSASRGKRQAGIDSDGNIEKYRKAIRDKLQKNAETKK